MRQFINIVEDFQGHEIDFEEWFDQYGSDVAEGSGIAEELEEQGIDASEEAIRFAIEERFSSHLDNVLFRMSKPLYRGMTVTQDGLDAILQGKGQVGIHWSVDPRIARRFANEGDADIAVIISAVAPANSVDIPRSVYLSFINYEEEDEIRLKPHSPVEITGVIVVDRQAKDISSHSVNVTASTGPNLYGSPYMESLTARL